MLDTVQYKNGEVSVLKNAICIFEYASSIPLRRHFDDIFWNYYQGMRDNVLIVRAIPTVFNIDYILDVEFHQGGQIKVGCALSGSTINAWYAGPQDDKYGHQMERRSLGPINEQLGNFKVDLDISGTSNRFHTLDISLEEIPDPIYEGHTLYNRKIDRLVNVNVFSMVSTVKCQNHWKSM